MMKFFWLMLFINSLAISTFAQTTKTLTLPKPTPVPPPGGIKILANYKHSPEHGVDAAVGKIFKPDGMIIEYLIGNNAELGASVMCYKRSNCLWFKRQIIDGREVLLGLSKEGRMVATYPKALANFYANTKSSEDVADFLLMILTYRGYEWNGENKTKTTKIKQKTQLTSLKSVNQR